MPKKAPKVDPALKARLEAEAAEREAAKAAKAANGVPGVKHRSAAEIRASAERRQRAENEEAAKAKRNQNKAIVLSDEAREAAVAASRAAAAAAEAAASAARAATAARIAQEEANSRSALRRHAQSAKFHRNNPRFGKVQELNDREAASKKRGGRRTRKNRH